MSEIIQSISPIDGSVVVERTVASATDLRRVLENARMAQAEWAAVSISERAVICSEIVDRLLAMEDDIVPELAKQMGRPVRYGAGELRGLEERARHMISIAEGSLAPLVIPESDANGDGTRVRRSIKREPVGLLFVIAPWNYPFLTAVNSIIPGLMAGNAVLLKHASQTLLVGERFQLACDEAGLPTGLFANLVLSHEQANQIISNRQVDRVHFTGSVRAGRAVESSAGGSFVGVGLELGGKDPAYVRSDADLNFAVEQLVDGCFFNSGQSCCGVERIYVESSVYSEFVDSFVKATRQYILGDPMDAETTLGPMISAEAADFVRKQIDEAVDNGAQTLINPAEFERDAVGSAYMAPQVVVSVDHSMSLMRDESFGPVVGIMAVESDDEAVALMNDSEFGLSASIWTQDLDTAVTIGDAIETGTVFMNRCDYLDPTLAWTGVKNTGRGATLSSVGYEHVTRPKSFYLREEP